jgi:HemX protein
MMVTILFALALVLYVGASGAFVASFAGGRGLAPRTGSAMAAGAAVLHVLGLITFTAQHGELPLVGLAPSLVTLGFLIALFLFTTSLTNDARPLGLVLVPLIAVLLSIALVLGISPEGQPLAFRGIWFSLHVLLAFIGYAGLTVAFAAGLLYLLQFRELKGKRLGRIFRFVPALPTLDRLGRLGLGVGFPALTLALLLGWAWTIRFQQTVAADNPQVIWGVVTWFAFAAVLALRAVRSPDAERRAAFASVVGFVVVVVSYLVLRALMADGRVFL